MKKKKKKKKAAVPRTGAKKPKTTRTPLHIEQAGEGFDADKFAGSLGDMIADAVLAEIDRRLAKEGKPPLQ